MVYFSRSKMISVLLVCLIGIVFSVPNFFNEKTLEGLPDWLPHKHVNLGLDLQGGMHLVLEVDTEKAVESTVERISQEIREQLKKKRIRHVVVERIEGIKISVNNIWDNINAVIS